MGGLGVVAAAGTLGTLPGWLTFLGVAVACWVFWRGGGGTAISSLESANRVLEKRVHDLESQVKEDAKTIAELRGRTDVSIALKPVIEASTQHDIRAQTRFEQTLKVLDLIAERLGPDNSS